MKVRPACGTVSEELRLTLRQHMADAARAIGRKIKLTVEQMAAIMVAAALRLREIHDYMQKHMIDVHDFLRWQADEKVVKERDRLMALA